MKKKIAVLLSVFLAFFAAADPVLAGWSSGSGTGSGTTNASDLSSGLVATARGGTNKDTSGSTGTPYVLSGTWTFDNAATALGRLGISAVENTALSTWAGTTNITTLGTIGTGTWNADVISKEMGGFGASIASQTGIPTWATGTITWNSWAAFLLQTGIIYNPADNTWIFPASITATEYVSSAADNTRGVTVPNTADPTGENLALGKCWFNITTNMFKCQNGDNSATLDIFTSGAAHTLNFATTGTLTGGIMILDNVVGPTAAQCYGAWNTITTAGTVTLPAVAEGMSHCVATEGALEITVELDGSDTFVLAGVTMDAGEAIINTTAEAAGDYICFIGTSSVKWRVAGKQGTWTQATP